MDGMRTRRWKYAAPPWRLWEALVDERDRWLDVASELAEARPPERAVLVLHLEEPVTVEVDVASDGGSGTQLTVTTPGPSVGRQFGADLRHHVDGW